MTTLAPTLEAFFTERLVHQRQASPKTIAAYRDTFRLLLGFIQHRTGNAPSALDFADVDAPLVGAFLEYVEHERHNTVRTRNARLAAIHSLFRFAALGHPEHSLLIQRVLLSQPNASTGRSSRSSPAMRSKRYLPARTDPAGSAGGTMRSCSSRSRRACDSLS